MADQSFEFDVLADLLNEAATVGQLAGNEKTFATAYEAFRSQDRKTFQAVLAKLRLTPRCRLVCEWIRIKECVFLCLRLCGPPKAIDKPPDPRLLAEAIVRVTSDPKAVAQLAKIVEKGDAAAFRKFVELHKLGPFCHFFCYWICLIRWRLLCRWMCDLQLKERPSLVTEITTAGRAISVLLRNEKAFAAAVAGAQAGDPDKIRAAVDLAGLTPFCRFICEWFCSWRCVFVCMTLCRQFPLPKIENEVQEAFTFAQATAKLAQQPLQLEKLSAAVGAGDAKAYSALLTQLKLERFCIQLCHWICFIRCRRFCILVCPPPDTTPLFTHVGIYAVPTPSLAGDFAADGTTNAGRLAHTSTIPLEGVSPDGQASQAYEYRFLVDPAASPPVPATTPAAGPKVAPTIIGQLEFWAYDNTLSIWYHDTRPVGVNTSFGSYNIPQPGSTFISTGPLDVSVAPDGWIQVPRMNDYTQGGIGRFVPGGGLAGTDALINLDTKQFTNESHNLGALAAGSPVPGPSLSPRPTFTITFEARVVGTSSLVSTNSLNVIAFSNTEFTYVRHTDWDGGTVTTTDVCSLDIKELAVPGAGCSKLTTTATALFTCYHPYLGSVRLWLQGPGIPYPPVAGPFTFTPALPPYGPGAVDLASGPAGHVFNISGLASCAYILHLETTLNLTTGDGAIGYLNEDLMAFCTQTAH